MYVKVTLFCILPPLYLKTPDMSMLYICRQKILEQIKVRQEKTTFHSSNITSPLTVINSASVD